MDIRATSAECHCLACLPWKGLQVPLPLRTHFRAVRIFISQASLELKQNQKTDKWRRKWDRVAFTLIYYSSEKNPVTSDCKMKCIKILYFGKVIRNLQNSEERFVK